MLGVWGIMGQFCQMALLLVGILMLVGPQANAQQDAVSISVVNPDRGSIAGGTRYVLQVAAIAAFPFPAFPSTAHLSALGL